MTDPTNSPALMASLPPLHRLALAYAPGRSREPTLALLALDARLAGLLRHSREPMLAQLRLAWWRETLAQDNTAWPQGEPLLAALRSWRGQHAGLIALVDGWEALAVTGPLGEGAMVQMIEGRAAAWEALAGVIGLSAQCEAAKQVATRWAAADLALHLRDPAEKDQATELAKPGEVVLPRLARALRPLAVMATLAQRQLAKGETSLSPTAMLTALRAGLLGR